MQVTVKDLINEIAKINYEYCFGRMCELQLKYLCGRGYVVDVESALDGDGYPYGLRSVARNDHFTDFGTPDVVLSELRFLEGNGQMKSLIEYYSQDFELVSEV